MLDNVTFVFLVGRSNQYKRQNYESQTKDTLAIVIKTLPTHKSWNLKPSPALNFDPLSPFGTYATIVASMCLCVIAISAGEDLTSAKYQLRNFKAYVLTTMF